jgi:hypothetical protein
MESLPRPTHLEINIDEWKVGQRKVDAVGVLISWRGAEDDPDLTAMLAKLPAKNKFVPIELVDGRTELAPEHWKHFRFGKGSSFFESARTNFEAWGQVWTGGTSLARDRKRLTNMVLRYVPDFRELTDKEQVDLLVRTQDKLNSIWDSVERLVSHLEHVTPNKGKALAPLENPTDNVRAAVFSDVMRSTRRAGEMLGVPLPSSDEDRHENQTVRQRAKLGRELLHYFYGKEEWERKVARMRGYLAWWDGFNNIENPKEQVLALVAKARGTSTEFEKQRANDDGFAEKLEKWLPIVERRLEADATYERLYDQNAPSDELEVARQAVNRAVREQFAFQDTDDRFHLAFSVFDVPPSQP